MKMMAPPNGFADMRNILDITIDRATT